MAWVIHPDGLTRVTTSTVGAEARVGQRYEDPATNFIYEYQKFVDAVTYAAGQAVEWADATRTSVTNDRSGGSAITGGRPAGVCMGAPAQNGYGWMMVRGYYATVVTNGDDDIAAGDAIIMASADGAVDSVAAATTTVHTKSLGFALAADVDAANTVAVAVNCEPR